MQILLVQRSKAAEESKVAVGFLGVSTLLREIMLSSI
jgi:hypothetical protein